MQCGTALSHRTFLRRHVQQAVNVLWQLILGFRDFIIAGEYNGTRPEITIGDLSGKWLINKKLSDETAPVLELQGIGWLLRKVIGLATVTLDVRQYVGEDGNVHIDIINVATGIQGISEIRTLDWAPREHSDYIFGKQKGQSRFVNFDSGLIDDDYLRRSGYTDLRKAKDQMARHISRRIYRVKVPGP
ncbi:hypothetical protein BP6252_04481 [Coleophoma cylindrospora]|uniref:Uncharacterized protein n=1 Tax=Coleophoma cylindrospora TaxID=1849047 RepID=A0A3D8S0L3_9HELO|nr:hypothetical protein BP6252_04481 [Coleophoma cylindrospora]